MKKTISQVVSERILILDGAMGTMIQQYNLKEEDFRGERFAEFFPLHIGVDHDRFHRPCRIDLENSEVNLFARVGASNFPFKVIGRIGFQLKFLGENIVIFAIGIRQFEGVFTAVVSSGIQLKRNEVEAQIGIGPQVTYQGESIRPQLEGAVEGEGGRI